MRYRNFSISLTYLIVLDEYQPVYEEFGYILLLVLAIVHRYKLTATDLGLQNEDSFVTNLLRRGSVSQKIENLTADQDKQLGDWIRGIFEVDGGINDDIMASCPPQDFYLLVPTLFSQSVSACSANIMDMETLKGGLECRLCFPLLLPTDFVADVT